MPRYGYACVSSTDQDCALQEARLRAAGCEVIRAERVSGKSRDGRDELARIMDFLHAGDELVVVKLDRLGRSTRDVLNLIHQLEARGCGSHPSPLTLVSTANQPSGSELAYRDPSVDVELSMSAQPLHQRPMVLVVEEEAHERVAIREY